MQIYRGSFLNFGGSFEHFGGYFARAPMNFFHCLQLQSDMMTLLQTPKHTDKLWFENGIE